MPSTSSLVLQASIFAQITKSPMVCEIKLWPLADAPQNWALCQGQVLNIEDHPTAGAMLGSTYGGDGVITFGLPDLRGRVALGADGSHALASNGGAATVTLVNSDLPPSQISSSAGATTPSAGANYLAATAAGPASAGIYTSTPPTSGCFLSGAATQTAVNITPAHVALNHIIYLG